MIIYVLPYYEFHNSGVISALSFSCSALRAFSTVIRLNKSNENLETKLRGEIQKVKPKVRKSRPFKNHAFIESPFDVCDPPPANGFASNFSFASFVKKK